MAPLAGATSPGGPPRALDAGAPASRHGRRWGPEADSLALVASSGSTALLGLAFWAAAAHAYPVAEVGRASAVITTAVVLSSVANLSLGALYERFLPVAGPRAGALVRRGHLLTAVLAAALGGALLAVGPREELFASGWELLAFPVLVVVLSVFALQDGVLVGLRAAPWVAVKNVLHAVAKLALVLAAAGTASAAGIASAWGVATVATAALGALAVRRSLRARGGPPGPRAGAAPAPALPPTRELWAFFGGSWALQTVMLVVPLVVPLVVVTRLGTERNAYFSLTWSLLAALSMALLVVVGPFAAHAASAPERLAAMSRRLVLLLGALGVGGGAFLAVGAPLVLGLLGEEYRTESTPLLRVLALALPLSVVAVLHLALARVHRRLAPAVLVRGLNAAVVVGGSLLLVDRWGLVGVGVAYLAAEALSAALLAPPLVRWLRQGRREAP